MAKSTDTPGFVLASASPLSRNGNVSCSTPSRALLCCRRPRRSGSNGNSVHTFDVFSERSSAFIGRSLDSKPLAIKLMRSSTRTIRHEVNGSAEATISGDVEAQRESLKSKEQVLIENEEPDHVPSEQQLHFYNTLTRRKEVFKPIDPSGKIVKFYSCGPTVYNFAHIGNFRAFLTYDVLKRYLKYKGYEVIHVMNITDIDDKIIKKVQAENSTLEDVTERYTEAFKQDMATLNIIAPDIFPKATEHIGEMIELVGGLVDRGFAYEKDGSIYFSVGAFPKYGKLARLDVKGMQVGASGTDADEYDKENVRDFVLWKAYKEQDGNIVWPGRRFSRGRPGWHLECSCMAMKYLGSSLDIHAGGVDLVFPHHENEIAQSECYSGEQFARYWIHNGFVNIDDEKMSKSLGNFLTVRDLVRTADDARAFRYLAVSSQYRSTLNFSDEVFSAAKTTISRLSLFINKLKGIAEQSGESHVETTDAEIELVNTARANFIKHMDDDLNSPRAVATLFDLVGQSEKLIRDGTLTGKGALNIVNFILSEVDSVLGVFYDVPFLEPLSKSEAELEQERAFAQLVDERNQARRDKNWARADEIRKLFLDAGFLLEDSPSGTTWKKKN